VTTSIVAASPRPLRRAWTIGQLVAQIQVGLGEAFPARFWVEGELSGFRTIRGGHAYCCLKDRGAQVEAMLWSEAVAALRFTPADGMQVIARVKKVDFYAPSGRLRLQIEALEPQGVGALARALEELRRRLQAEGLFDEARKRPLPLLPRTVGIATAASGAVIQDMLRILGQRFAERRVLLRPCRVQGDGAADDIARAIDDLNRDGSAEVIIVGRGGGSAEDLWAFHSEIVVRAIARSRVPVVSAVGHESDVTLADLVADLRAPTPTAAAQRVMPERAVLEAELAKLRHRLLGALERQVERARARVATKEAAFGDPRRLARDRRLELEALAARSRVACGQSARRARRRLGHAAIVLRASLPDSSALRARLERLALRLVAAMRSCRVDSGARLAARAASLDALSPLAVLGRGFALARLDDGTIVRDGGLLRGGDHLDLRFARGKARAEVIEASSEKAPASEAAVDAERRRELG